MSDEAAAIIEQMRAAYSTCLTYRDEGEVVLHHMTDGRVRRHRRFATTFDRLRGFRFVWDRRYFEVDPWQRHAIWLEKGRVRVWDGSSRAAAFASTLGAAMTAHSVQSHFATLRIPLLLMPNMADRSRMQPFESEDITVELLPDERGCAVVKYTRSDPRHAERIWIDRASHEIRLIQLETRQCLVLPQDPDEGKPGFEPRSTDSLDGEQGKVLTQTEYVYRVSMNVPVRDEELVFEPPIG